MFLVGLVCQFSDYFRLDEYDEDFEVELREIDCFMDDFEVILMFYLGCCIEKGILNIVCYGFIFVGFRLIEGG